MNKLEQEYFTSELTKEAGWKTPLKSLLSRVRSARAGRAGEKNIISTIDKEIKQLKLKDPNFQAGPYRQTRMTQLKTQGRQESAEKANAFIKGETKATQPTFLSRHKGKLLLGGAGVGTLYAVNKANTKDEEQRQEMSAIRFQ